MIAAEVLAELTECVGSLDGDSIERVGGGSINTCYSIRAQDGARYFLKTSSQAIPQVRDMFAAEQAGLAELAAAQCVRVPSPIALGDSWLLMEYLPLGRADEHAETRLGTLLARQHRHTARKFGWDRDNTIGSTPQSNDQGEDWLEFFGTHRLGYQRSLAAKSGAADSIDSLIKELIGALPAFFVDYRPEPSLLHGDLWGGNWGATGNGEPVCFDPAVYYGDRETDLAMTKLFGGFGPAFYAAYNKEWPLDPGFAQRTDLYNLYHVLNHLNLFGSGYLGQAQAMLARLLSRV